MTRPNAQAGGVGGERKVRGAGIAPAIDQQEGVHRAETGGHIVTHARVIAGDSGYAIVSGGDVVENCRPPGRLLTGQGVQGRVNASPRSARVLEDEGHYTCYRRSGSGCAADIERPALDLNDVGIVNRGRRGNIRNQAPITRRNSRCGLPTGPRVDGAHSASGGKDCSSP